jgi:hypothetical protein
MRVLLDNTLLHRVGTVLDSEPGSAVKAVDALALFHMAEHILFSDGILVSNFALNPTYQRTQEVVKSLVKEGFLAGESRAPLASIEEFSAEDYSSACRRAARNLAEK